MVVPVERDGVEQTWTFASVARPKWCLSLSTRDLWQSWLAVCQDSALKMVMQCSGWQTLEAEPIYERKRRLHDFQGFLGCCFPSPGSHISACHEYSIFIHSIYMWCHYHWSLVHLRIGFIVSMPAVFLCRVTNRKSILVCIILGCQNLRINSYDIFVIFSKVENPHLGSGVKE